MASSSPLVIDQSASCACGRIGLSLHGRVLSMFYCTCIECQKASGGGHSAIVLVKRDSVTVSGRRSTYTRLADSGAVFSREFCPDCATPILAHSSRAPDMCLLPAGLFAPDNGWFDPNQVLFARSHRHWDTIADHLPRHETYRPGATS